MDASFPILEFLIAALIGALVGMEREKKLSEEHDQGIGGIRTFTLFALTGGVAAWLSLELDSVWIFIGIGLCMTAAVLAGYIVNARANSASVGMTTEIAAVVVYLLGGTTLFGHSGLAVALAITVSVILAIKRPLHKLVGKIDQEDLYAGLKLLVATFIVLPVLPNRTVDPWDALNPYKMWWLVILISGLSLVGYIASRVLGSQRGTALTGFFGGLASSTAVSLDFARRSRTEGTTAVTASAFATGLLLSWVVMFGRVIVEVAVVHAPLLANLLVPMITMAMVTAAAAIGMYRLSSGSSTQSSQVPLKNPFSLASAIKFALLFSIVLLGVKIVQQYTEGEGLYLVAALAGLTDVDAITLSMAAFARNGGHTGVAVNSITIAVMTNTAVKCGVVTALGSAALRNRTLAATACVVIAGVVALLVG